MCSDMEKNDIMDLKECREKIDRIDGEILRLFEERMKVSDDVARYKRAHGLPILDFARERQKIEGLRDLAGPDTDGEDVEVLFTQIMSLSRKRQHRRLEEGMR